MLSVFLDQNIGPHQIAYKIRVSMKIQFFFTFSHNFHNFELKRLEVHGVYMQSKNIRNEKKYILIKCFIAFVSWTSRFNENLIFCTCCVLSAKLYCFLKNLPFCAGDTLSCPLALATRPFMWWRGFGSQNNNRGLSPEDRKNRSPLKAQFPSKI